MAENVPLPVAAEEDLGPRKIGNAKLIYKTIMGILGGIAGMLVLFIVVMLSSQFFPSIMSSTDPTVVGINPVLLFIVLVAVFLTTLFGNLVTVTLFYVVDRDKYPKLTTNLIQGFIFNLLIFIFSLPLYLIVQGSNITTLVYIIGIHFLLSAFITSIAVEVLAGGKYILVGLYGNTFAILAALVVNVLIFATIPDSGKAFLLFLTMPIIWGSIGFFQSLTEMIYRWFYDVYGMDFLSRETQYEDTEKPSEEDEEEKEEENN